MRRTEAFQGVRTVVFLGLLQRWGPQKHVPIASLSSPSASAIPATPRDDGLLGMLPQFNYTKMIIVVDDDINAQRWEDIAWATATRMDSSRDLMLVENSPIDYLDFPSPSRALAASPASTPP